MKELITSLFLCIISSALCGEVILGSPSGTAKVVLAAEEAAVVAGSGNDVSLFIGDDASTTVIWSPGGNYVCISSEIKRGNAIYLVGVIEARAKEIHLKETSFGDMVSAKYSPKYTLGRIMTITPLKWQNDKRLVVRLTGNLKDKDSGGEKWYRTELILNFEADKCSVLSEPRWEELSSK